MRAQSPPHRDDRFSFIPIADTGRRRTATHARHAGGRRVRARLCGPAAPDDPGGSARRCPLGGRGDGRLPRRGRHRAGHRDAATAGHLRRAALARRRPAGEFRTDPATAGRWPPTGGLVSARHRRGEPGCDPGRPGQRRLGAGPRAAGGARLARPDRHPAGRIRAARWPRPRRARRRHPAAGTGARPGQRNPRRHPADLELRRELAHGGCCRHVDLQVGLSAATSRLLATLMSQPSRSVLPGCGTATAPGYR